MGKQEELDKLKRILKECEIKSNTLNMNINIIEKDIDVMLILKAQIEENIQVLKANHIVALITEYKKTKEDLKKVNNKINLLRIELGKYKKVFSDNENFLIKNKEVYDKLNDIQENNVIQGRFGLR